MHLTTLLTLALLHLPPTAQAASPQAYTKAVTDIRELYLRPEELVPADLLFNAALRAADDVDWLMVERTADGVVHARHGDGTPIGSVSVAALDGLPDALRSLEDLIALSGFDTGDADVRLSLLDGMTDTLDRYSRVLAGDGLDRFEVRLTGTLVGIGVTFRLDEDEPRLVELIDGPAAAAGLQRGDVITHVDGVPTLNMSKERISQHIRGEDGTDVVLGIRRDDAHFEVTVTRAQITLPNVTHEVLDGSVGYVRIDHFSQVTVRNLRAALAALRADGALSEGLVIDLRGNTGGSMKEAARSADQFLTTGVLLRTVGHNGARVENLQGEMTAIDAGDEPEVPIAVLMDRRTASGSEILAGALLAHHRAVLVGARSYGKGTVQKIYRLDPDTRLKLTVARYLLADDLSVADHGLVPDVAVGEVVLDTSGASYRRWSEAHTGAAWDDVVPSVQERESWRGAPAEPHDVALDLARRALLASTGWQREDVLTALSAVAAEVREEEQARLTDAFEAHNIDWSATPAPDPAAELPDVAPAGKPDASVTLTAKRDGNRPDTYVLEASVVNRGEQDLHRATVALQCDSFRSWNDVAVPVGRVAAGETATGSVTVTLRPGYAPREDDVRLSLRTDGHLALEGQPTLIASQSTPRPRLSLRAALSGDGADRVADVTLQNLSSPTLRGLEVAFAAPEDVSVSLVDHSAGITALSGGATAHVPLGLHISGAPPALLPLRLTVNNRAFGRLAVWDVALPSDGSTVTLEAPAVLLGDLPVSAPSGRYTLSLGAADDNTVDHLVVSRHGQKIAWAPGGAPELSLQLDVVLDDGPNRFTITATDSDGLRTQRAVTIRGQSVASADAATP